MVNIEAKYLVTDFTALEKYLENEPAIQFCWTHVQKDVYYNCASGRLKMRIVEGRPAELIAYQRADEAFLRDSVYEIFRTQDWDALNRVLQASLGTKVEVQKARRLYLYKNVRIHLDEVDALGRFLELESVVSENTPHSIAQKNLDELTEKLKPFLGEILPVSYSDLILQMGEEKNE